MSQDQTILNQSTSYIPTLSSAASKSPTSAITSNISAVPTTANPSTSSIATNSNVSTISDSKNQLNDRKTFLEVIDTSKLMLKERNYYKDELEKANVVITQQDEKLEKAVKTNLELSNDYNKLAANYSNLQNLSRSALAKLNATVGTRDAKIQQLESELAQEKNTTTGLRKTVSNNEEKIQQLESELAQEKDKVGELTEVLLKTSEIVSSSNQNLEESIKARESSSQVPEVNIENVKLDEDLLKYLSDINAGNV